MKTTLFQRFLNLFKDPRKRIFAAVQLTQWLKESIDSDVALAIVNIIPGDKDNAFRDKASRRLAEVLNYLGLISNLTFISKAAVAKLKGPERAQYLTAIAAELAHRDLWIDYDSAREQTQLVYVTDPAFNA